MRKIEEKVLKVKDLKMKDREYEETKIELKIKCWSNKEFKRKTLGKLKEILESVFSSRNWRVKELLHKNSEVYLITPDGDNVFIFEISDETTVISKRYIKSAQFIYATSPICRFCKNLKVPEENDSIHRKNGKIARVSCKIKGGWRDPLKERNCDFFVPISKKYEHLIR